ncbi:hypothetical protein F4776DRAFT_669833 [Hypoxylon sp. NC0597]|nr:hypothetical protein F4776DRAFT_669833 [Hypoxylon sp. NC0597]
MSGEKSTSSRRPVGTESWLHSSILPLYPPLLGRARANRHTTTSSEHNAGPNLPSNRSPIEDLSAEIVLKIMKLLPDHNSVIGFTKAFPKAFRIYKAYPGVVLKELLLKDLGGLLPIAVARLVASEAGWVPKKPLQLTAPCVDYGTKVTGFCQQYLADHEKLCVLDPYFTFERASEIWSFHSTVMSWVEAFGWIIIGETTGIEHSHTPYHRRLNQLESCRFQKILYITELTSILLPIRYGIVQPNDRDNLWESFWQHFAPWEFCQYADVQLLLQRFCRDTLNDSNNTSMGTRLRQIDPFLRRSGREELGHISEVLAFQAGLVALESTMSSMVLPERFSISSKFLHVVRNIVGNPGILRRDRGRYFQPWSLNWRQEVAAKYKNLWLDKIDGADGSTVYSVNIDRLTEKYKDADDAPFSCWLQDLLKFVDHHSVRIFKVRARHLHFPLSSFWSERRWDSENVKLRPPIALMKLIAEVHVLTEDNRVIPLVEDPLESYEGNI